MVVGTSKISLDQLVEELNKVLLCVMTACGRKLVSRSDRRATVAESVFVG